MLVVTNANAGSNDEETVRHIAESLRSHVTDVTVASTQGPQELRNVLSRHDDRTVVCLGGDGSLHALLQALYDTDQLDHRTVGLLPLGTGNDFARGVGLPVDPDESVTALLAGSAHPVDLIVDESGSVVVNAVHMGVGAAAGSAAHRVKQALGPASFPVGALAAGLRHRGHRLRVEVDGRVVTRGNRRVLMVGVANARTIAGGTAVLGPEATVADGRADVSVSYAVGPLARIGYALHLRRGRHPQRPDVVTVRARRIDVRGEPFHTNADGEITGPYRRRTWQVRHAAWRLLLPGTAAPHGPESESPEARPAAAG